LGYVITGEVEIAGNKVLMGTHTSMEAEYHALTEALRVASLESSSRSKVEAHVDVKPLTTKMRAPDANSEEWRTRRRGFHWLANKFDEWELKYIPRENNKQADRLAKEALLDGRSRV
jgi:ribonuclease HI